ncbi:PAS domain-containing protein, partial [Deinococcus oregonensis]
MIELDQSAPPTHRPDLTLLYDAPVASLWLTLDGRIQHLNALAHALLNLPPTPQEGRRFVALFPPAVQAAFTTFLTQVAAGQTAQTLETQLARSDGTTLHLRIDGIAGKVAGQLTHVHLVLTDITPYKQAHQTGLTPFDRTTGQDTSPQSAGTL